MQASATFAKWEIRKSIFGACMMSMNILFWSLVTYNEFGNSTILFLAGANVHD